MHNRFSVFDGDDKFIGFFNPELRESVTEAELLEMEAIKRRFWLHIVDNESGKTRRLLVRLQVESVTDLTEAPEED